MGHEIANLLCNPVDSSTICLAIQSGLPNSVFLTELVFAFYISPVLVTYLSQLILLNFVTLILFGEELEILLLLLVFRYVCVCVCVCVCTKPPSPCRWRATLAR